MMERRLLRFLGRSGRTRTGEVELRLIPAEALLQARNEARELAGADEKALGLCLNACIVARAAYGKDGKRAFRDGAEVLRRVNAERIGAWAERYLALCAEQGVGFDRENRESLQKALEQEPYERLKWRVLRAFGVLPSERRAREMTGADYLYCVMQLTLDGEEELKRLCPECREKAGENVCVCCGAALAEENPGFDEERYEELRHGVCR